MPSRPSWQTASSILSLIVKTFALMERRTRRLSRHRTARYRPKSRCPETAGSVQRHRRCAGQPLRSPAYTRRGDKAAQLCRVTAHVISTGGVDSAAVYCEAELDASAMALGGLGHHAPVSVKRRGNCGRSGTDGCGSGRQSDGTDTIADHGSPPVSRPGARLLGDDRLTRINESRRRIERSTARVTPQHTGCYNNPAMLKAKT